MVLEDELLEQVTENIIIFVDEIDRINSLEFKDDFFAFVRSCCNKRAINLKYHRLTFVLLGVATPADLIADTNYTLFNIDSKAIELTGFKLEEAAPLEQGLISKVNHPKAVLKEILNWTCGQPFLTQWLCQLVATVDFVPVNTNSEVEWVAEIVRIGIINNWHTHDSQQHFQNICNRILNDESRACRLLGLYQQILQQREVIADDSPEQMQLRLSGVVVKQQGKLRVYNRIYESVFNINWVENELVNLRPAFYSEALTAWLASNRQEESWLLRGKALEEARAWAKGKSLKDEDYQFLDASQEFDKREVENTLAVKEEEGRILSEANKTLSQAQRKAKRQIRIGGAILALSLIVAGIIAGLANKQLQEAKEVTKLEQSGFMALQQFKFQEIDALLSAMKAGQRLKQMVRDGRPLEKYPATSPILALQTILDNIRESQRTYIEELQLQYIKDISYSPDGLRILTVSAVNGTVQIRDLSSKKLAELKIKVDFDISPKFSRNGKYIVTTSRDKKVQVWNLSGKQLAEISHERKIESTSVSPDGQHIVTLSHFPPSIHVWNLSGKQLAVLEGDERLIGTSFSPDGQRILTYGNDVRMWDLSGKLLAEFKGHKDAETADFSPDGQHIITESGYHTVRESGSHTVRVSDLSGKQLTEIQGLKGVTTKVGFSPDGKQIIRLSDNSLVQIWNLSGQQIAELRGYKDNIVENFAFSSNGKQILTLGNSQHLQVWDFSNKPLTEIKKFGANFYKPVFSPDGKRLLTMTNQGKLKVWISLAGS
ncbi:AAA-like domain-containing protein [Scytonema sp. PRP1]|uniref:AAA-like domain-containing protein n=1 Tax=Scytonema sp. PRP1 TaxID=3120513 RepID=UPI00300D4EF2